MAASFSSHLPVVLLSDKVRGEGKDLFKQTFFLSFLFFLFLLINECPGDLHVVALHFFLVNASEIRLMRLSLFQK